MSQSRNPSPTDDYGTCRCKPSCGKWLSKSARNKHYRKFINNELECMEDSDQEDDEDRYMEQESGSSNDDSTGRSFHTGSSEDVMSIDDGCSQAACSDIDCDESSDHSYASETPINIPENFIFDEEADDDEYLHLSLQDIAEQLNAWADPNGDGDFYDVHECFSIQLT
ncbi:uncharacterized protein EDB91DRAFT_1246408 [Suillus paluster]|uniref:uncharacterized protein n=1 Tax=Suillus paluster TaxID=48578 RepID=UPI001B85F417|nr:uncharacterized protein EDB91DRAFT_1246408 [Suillus paluster]KAG1745530.1 hypothetical protein EDB91DRAFT_1246408 [Suillus paluster]